MVARSSLPPGFARAAADAVGPHLITDPERLVAHEVDWTGRYRGEAAAVVRPGSTAEVAALVLAARAHGVALVPQGGNTGLVGGAVPTAGAVVVDLGRLAAIGDVDERAGQLTAGAGATIAAVQDAAARAGWAYGVDWAARDTATIGGSVATNAGGLRVVRHGPTRHQLLGVEAVLGTGAVVSHLSRVAKDATGPDLGQVLCGSEGTLGLVTAVRLRLVPPRPPVAGALVAFGSVAAAVDAAAAVRRRLPELEAVELVLGDGLDLVADQLEFPRPFARPPAAALLVEVAAPERPAERLAEVVAGLPGVGEALVAEAGPRLAALWRYREGHTEALARIGPPHKLDVSVPAGALAPFLERVPDLVAAVAPGARTWAFGHAADGNLHVNVTGVDPDEHATHDAIDEVVLGAVAAAGGSIAGEHGIGRAKRRWVHLARTPSELEALRALKAAFDPDGTCNPGVLLP